VSESDFAMSFVDIVGYAAALAVLGSFCMNTIVPLRILAVVSNVLFGLYGVLADLYPVFFLHSILLPINLFKLARILLPINVFELARKRSISQTKRLSHWAAPLTALVFAVPTLAPTIAKAQADVFDAANLYPGRYAAVCIPAPMFGCVCTTDPLGEALMFTELDSAADHHLKDIGDTEYLRMISWLRRTCASLAESVVPP
jgi:hypothetical protein